jgi:hypothetical protein
MMTTRREFLKTVGVLPVVGVAATSCTATLPAADVTHAVERELKYSGACDLYIVLEGRARIRMLELTHVLSENVKEAIAKYVSEYERWRMTHDSGLSTFDMLYGEQWRVEKAIALLRADFTSALHELFDLPESVYPYVSAHADYINTQDRPRVFVSEYHSLMLNIILFATNRETLSHEFLKFTAVLSELVKSDNTFKKLPKPLTRAQIQDKCNEMKFQRRGLYDFSYLKADDFTRDRSKEVYSFCKGDL